MVVTIDFDIIMAPIIGMYNGEIDENITIDFLIKQYPYLEYVPADLDIYAYLTDFITKVINRIPKTRVKFLRSHDEMVPCLDKRKEIELVNIDHHHDVGYDIENWKMPLLGLDYDCGNWVKRLDDNGVLHSYTWVHNPTSDELTDPDAQHYITDQYLLKEFDLMGLVQDVDELYICGSFEWVPAKYQPLFETWKIICTNHYRAVKGYF